MSEGSAKMNAPIIWPETTAIPAPVKNILIRLLNLLDDKATDSGERLANEVFTPDGHLGAFSKVAQGSSEIRESRKNAWDLVDHRRHVMNRVYVNSDREFLFLGHFEVRTKTGKTYDDDFVGQIVVDDASSATPRIKYFNAILNKQPVLDVLRS